MGDAESGEGVVRGRVPATAAATPEARGGLGLLALGALGVVYGDIGTSPLYALEQCVAFVGAKGLPIRTVEVLGILSLIFWALTLVVSVKYLAVIMRADNRGEGGILALLALVDPPDSPASETRRGAILAGLGIFGAALLYGDGVITPAISVLSAVEGLSVATSRLEPFVVPITVALLVLLFAVQRFGTSGVAAFFGPAMLLWFVTIGGLGAWRIVGQHSDHVSVLLALNPLQAVSFLGSHGGAGFFILASVVLAVTGAEALYADMGHFGARPIRVAWSAVVFPALVLNYFGQGVLMLERGGKVKHPFFDLAPEWGLLPLVGLSTVATIIASQALISGAFSLTQQAVQLGYAPRFSVKHTSRHARGQIYMPQVNLALMLGCVILVVGFRSSDALASAYGIAVTGTMSVTSILFFVVARERFGWSLLHAGALVGLFLAVDLAFFAANSDKIGTGGWFPVAVALAIFAAMTTWKRGRMLLAKILARAGQDPQAFFERLERERPIRVPGTAVYLSGNATGIPALLLHNLEANGVLHERVVLLTIAIAEFPAVRHDQRVLIVDLGHGFSRIVAFFGFMEEPKLAPILAECQRQGFGLDAANVKYFLARDAMLPSGPSPMARWRKRLFGFMWRNMPSATDYFEIPPSRVIELGVRVEL